uniref:Secreted protein n=1 Tax=Ascaris lumbricoides TaxID=6252 RepID=A0A0M3I6V4_ASCLU
MRASGRALVLCPMSCSALLSALSPRKQPTRTHVYTPIDPFAAASQQCARLCLNTILPSHVIPPCAPLELAGVFNTSESCEH